MDFSEGGSTLCSPLSPGGGSDQVTAPAVQPKPSCSSEVSWRCPPSAGEK